MYKLHPIVLLTCIPLDEQMSEPFTFDVNYATTFEDLEKLRGKMVAFLESERRDFQPVFDVSVVGSCDNI